MSETGEGRGPGRDILIASLVVLAYAGVVALFFIMSGGNAPSTVGGPLDFEVGFETGDFSELGATPFTNSESTEVEIVSDPTHSGDYALAMTVTDAGSGTAVRTRIDADILADDGYAGGDNLPPEAYFSAWYYIPEYVDLGGGDGWNIFQFKQSDPGDNGMTRRTIDSIKLWDRGGDYGFAFLSNIDATGRWNPRTSRGWENDEVRVSPGEWFQVNTLRRFGGVGEGHYTVWVNDTEIFDLDIPTEVYGGSWDKWGEWRRQWLVTNLVTSDSHQPNTHTLYVDDLAVRTPDATED